MKAAPVTAALAEQNGISRVLVHTGQHCDGNMSEVFFHQLEIPEPDMILEVGPGPHAVQAAEMMRL